MTQQPTNVVIASRVEGGRCQNDGGYMAMMQETKDRSIKLDAYFPKHIFSQTKRFRLKTAIHTKILDARDAEIVDADCGLVASIGYLKADIFGGGHELELQICQSKRRAAYKNEKC